MEILNQDNALALDQSYLFEKAIEIFDKPWKTWETEEKYLAFAALNKFDFFQRKSNETHLNDLIQACLRKVKLEYFKPGQAIYHIGDDSKKLYFIIKGIGIKFKPKTDEEIEKYRLQAEEKHHRAPKFLDVLNMLGVGKGADNSNNNNKQGILKKGIINGTIATSAKKQLIFNTKRNVLSKLKDIKDLIPISINFDILPHIGNLKISEKYFKDDNCMIRYEKKVNVGDILGETDVLFDQAHNSFIFAITDLYALTITKKDINNIFDQLNTTNERKDLFGKILPQLREDIIKKFCMCLEEKSYRINDIIYDQDDIADAVYFVKTGDVQLLKSVENQILNENNDIHVSSTQDLHIHSVSESKQAKRVLLTLISQNQFFGEEVLLSKKKREHRALAASNIILFKLNHRIIRKNPIDLFQLIDWIRKNAIKKIEWREHRFKNLVKKEAFSKEKEERVNLNNNSNNNGNMMPKDINNVLMTQRENTQKIIKNLRNNRTTLNFHGNSFLQRVSQEKENDSSLLKQYEIESKLIPSRKNRLIEKNMKEHIAEMNLEMRQKSSIFCDSATHIHSFLTNPPSSLMEIPINPNLSRLPLIERIKQNSSSQSKKNLLKSTEKSDTIDENLKSRPLNNIQGSLQGTLKEKFETICKSASSESLINRFRSTTKLMSMVESTAAAATTGADTGTNIGIPRDSNTNNIVCNSINTPSDTPDDCFNFTSPKMLLGNNHRLIDFVENIRDKSAYIPNITNTTTTTASGSGGDYACGGMNNGSGSGGYIGIGTGTSTCAAIGVGGINSNSNGGGCMSSGNGCGYIGTGTGACAGVGIGGIRSNSGSGISSNSNRYIGTGTSVGVSGINNHNSGGGGGSGYIGAGVSVNGINSNSGGGSNAHYQPTIISIISYNKLIQTKEKPKSSHQSASSKYMEARRKQDQNLSNNITESSINSDRRHLQTTTGNTRISLNKTNTLSNISDNVSSPRLSSYSTKIIPNPLPEPKQQLNYTHFNFFGPRKIKLTKSNSSVKLQQGQVTV